MDANATYTYHDAAPTYANTYLWPVLKQQIDARFNPLKPGLRALDLGCGSGATSNMLANMGFSVTGIDSSQSGIHFARKAYPQCRFHVASVYDDLASEYGQFALAVSLEVIEHLYDPRRFLKNMYALADPGGIVTISTPYHGYWKNLALALTGKLEGHFTALWDGGHIKFFSIDTLGQLLSEAGFEDVHFFRAGRVPALAKSMIAVAQKPRAG